jgi:hypothetical protein
VDLPEPDTPMTATSSTVVDQQGRRPCRACTSMPSAV